MKPVGKAKSVSGRNNSVAKDDDSYLDDGIVIVAFPSNTWERVNLIAANMGITSSEVLSRAIEKFENEMEENV